MWATHQPEFLPCEVLDPVKACLSVLDTLDVSLQQSVSLLEPVQLFLLVTEITLEQASKTMKACYVQQHRRGGREER